MSHRTRLRCGNEMHKTIYNAREKPVWRVCIWLRSKEDAIYVVLMVIMKKTSRREINELKGTSQ
jgi:hypothetical protein